MEGPQKLLINMPAGCSLVEIWLVREVDLVLDGRAKDEEISGQAIM